MPATGILDITCPLVRRTMSVPVLTNERVLKADLVYYSPCKTLVQEMPQEYAKVLKEWCDRHYQTCFLEPVKVLCVPPATRKKRVVALMAIATLSAVGVNTMGAVLCNQYEIHAINLGTHDAWNKDRMHANLFRLFNITPPVGFSVKYMKPLGCELDQIHQMLELNIQIY